MRDLVPNTEFSIHRMCSLTLKKSLFFFSAIDMRDLVPNTEFSIVRVIITSTTKVMIVGGTGDSSNATFPVLIECVLLLIECVLLCLMIVGEWRQQQRHVPGADRMCSLTDRMCSLTDRMCSLTAARMCSLTTFLVLIECVLLLIECVLLLICVLICVFIWSHC